VAGSVTEPVTITESKPEAERFEDSKTITLRHAFLRLSIHDAQDLIAAVLSHLGELAEQ
jgi:hypothetical protein